MLVKVAGTPFSDLEDMDPFEFVRTIAVARILMPTSHVRLSAGREDMNDQMQALAFLAGANSSFYGEKLLTTLNPETNEDMRLFQRLGIQRELDTETATREEEAFAEVLEEARSDRYFYDATEHDGTETPAH